MPRVNEEDARVRLIAQGTDLWKVQMLFKSGEDERIPTLLQQIKADLADGFGVPDSLLEYIGILSRRETRNGLLVEMQIRKQTIPSGEPIIRYLPAVADDGIEYANMMIEADLYPCDRFGKPISRRAIEARLSTDRVDLACIEWSAVDYAIARARETVNAVRNVEIGRGRLPDGGAPARIHFFAATDPRLAATAWQGTRPVGEEELLAEVHAAGRGVNPGVDVFAREIEPRIHPAIRMIAGDGCTVSALGNRVVASRSGLLLITREFHDRRARDGHSAQPTKITLTVVSPELVEGTIDPELTLDRPAVVQGTVRKGSSIRAHSHLCIIGDVESECEVSCDGTLRIIGDIEGASLSTRHHLSITGTVSDALLNCELTAHVDGTAKECTIYAREIVAAKLVGGTAEALTQTKLQDGDPIGDALVRVNRRRFLEIQQRDGLEAVEELRVQMSIVSDLFGAEIVQRVTEDSIQMMMMRWLRRHKLKNSRPLSFGEVQRFRQILEIVPTLRARLADVGAELRDVTSELDETDDDEPADE